MSRAADDFDVISDRYKEILKEKETALKNDGTETTQTKVPAEDTTEYYGCAPMIINSNPYTRITIMPEAREQPHEYGLWCHEYRPGTPTNKYYGDPVFRVLP